MGLVLLAEETSEFGKFNELSMVRLASIAFADRTEEDGKLVKPGRTLDEG